MRYDLAFTKTYKFDDSLNECAEDFNEYARTRINFDLNCKLHLRNVEPIEELSEWSKDRICEWDFDNFANGYDEVVPSYDCWSEINWHVASIIGLDAVKHNYSHPVTLEDNEPYCKFGDSEWQSVVMLDIDDLPFWQGITELDLDEERSKWRGLF